MFIAICDWLFTRRKWTVINEGPIDWVNVDGSKRRLGRLYVLQDQFGNIKEKRVGEEK